MKRHVIYIMCLMVLPLQIWASNDGGTESPFILGAGARDLALGGANQAANSSATAPFWNPSGLASAEQLSISGFHSRLYDSDVAYQYFGLIYPTMDRGTFGIGVFRLGIDNIERRDDDNLYLGTFNDTRMAFYLAYGRKIGGYDMGLAATFEHHSLDEYSTTSSPGLNFSIGRTFKRDEGRLRKISLAFNGRNLLQPSMRLNEQNVNYPTAVDLAASLDFVPFGNEQHKTTLSAKLSKVESLSAVLSAGLDYGIHDMVHLRGGIRDGKPAVGGGLSYKGIDFDYALIDRDLGSLHMFSVSMSFGRTVSEKRKIRIERQEAAFNSMMNDHLKDRNLKIISDLKQLGKKNFDEGKLTEASSCFDRALFLARTGAADTTELHRLATEARTRLEEVTLKMRFAQYMDSAQVKFDKQDYMGARYFASLALGEIPGSTEAAGLRKKAELALQQIASEKEMITNELSQIDSLINYGQIEKALTVINTLKQYAPGDPRVDQAEKKVIFQKLRENIITAFDHKSYRDAINNIDSALVLFPYHRWCLDMKERANAELSRMREAEKAVRKEKPKTLSPELAREADLIYREAMKYFEQGNLQDAIDDWEKVERIAPDYQSVRPYLVKAYKFVGVELYGQNKLEDAITVWKKAAALDPMNDEINDYIKRSENELRKLKELSYE